MLEFPDRIAYRKIVQTGRMAEALGAQILGLGAYTSVVGDAGVTIARELAVPVTAGDAFTVSVAVQAVCAVADMMGIVLQGATAAVVGATGAIGRVWYVLAPSTVVYGLAIVSRNVSPVAMMQTPARKATNAVVEDTVPSCTMALICVAGMNQKPPAATISSPAVCDLLIHKPRHDEYQKAADNQDDAFGHDASCS